MKAHLIDTHLLVLSSRSSAKVKVKYQGHVSEDGCFGGISGSQAHLVSSITGSYHRLAFCLMIPTFNDSKEGGFAKHCGKRRKCW